MIAELTIQNFKGITATEKLGRLNLFCGPNGSGKSARLLAPQYAVTGRTPAGAKPDDVMKLADKPILAVTVALDNGFTWTRRAARDTRTDKVTTAIELTGLAPHERAALGTGLRQAETEVHKRVGNFAPMFNVGEFLGLSPEKRRQMVLSLCGVTGEKPDWGDLEAELTIEYAKLSMGETTVDAHRATYNMVRAPDDLEEGFATFLSGQLSVEEHGAFVTVLDQVCEAATAAPDHLNAVAEAIRTAADVSNQARVQANSAIAASRELSTRKAEIAVVSASIPELDAREKEFKERKEACIRDAAEAKGRSAAVESLQGQLAKANDDMTETSLALTSEKAFDPDNARRHLEKLWAEATAAEAILNEPVERTELQEQRSKLKSSRGELYQRDCHTRMRIDRLRADIDGQRRRNRLIEQARIASPEVLDGLEATYRGLRTDPRWIEIRAGLEKLMPQDPIEDGERYVDDLKKNLAETEEYAKTQDAALKSVEEELKTLPDESQPSEDLAIRRREAGETLTRKQRDAVLLERTIEDHAQNLRTAEINLKTAQGHRLAIEGQLETAIGEAGAVSIDEQQKTEAALAAELEQIRETVRRKEAYQALERELAGCIARSEAQLRIRDVAKNVAQAGRVLRESLIQTAVAPLMDRVREFLGHAKPEVTPCLDVDDKSFDFGWTRPDGRCVVLDALSAGETAIYYAAIAYALVVLADTPLKLLLIELSEIDEDNMPNVVKGLNATDPSVQVIAATHAAPDQSELTRADWNIVNLEAIEEVPDEQEAAHTGARP